MRISDWSSDVCSSDLESWLVAMPSEHRLADFEVIAISDLAGENFVAAHQEFGPGCHQQTQEMFLAAGVRLHVVARAFRRMTMLMLVHRSEARRVGKELVGRCKSRWSPYS